MGSEAICQALPARTRASRPCLVTGCACRERARLALGSEKVRCLACSYNYLHRALQLRFLHCEALATGAHELLATVDWQRGGDSRCGGAIILAVLGVCCGCTHVKDVGTHAHARREKATEHAHAKAYPGMRGEGVFLHRTMRRRSAPIRRG